METVLPKVLGALLEGLGKSQGQIAGPNPALGSAEQGWGNPGELPK